VADGPFLTVEEAAERLRIGRTLAYQLARRYRDTAGAEGLPVVVFGNVLRVPKAKLVELAGGPIDESKPATVIPMPARRDDDPPPPPKPARRPRQPKPITTQTALLFTQSTDAPNAS
jgi:hypothetical protein